MDGVDTIEKASAALVREKSYGDTLNGVELCRYQIVEYALTRTESS